MSYNLYVTNRTGNIGLLPSSELITFLGGNDTPDFDDIVNAWVLYTRRTISSDPTLTAILAAKPSLLDNLIVSATGFAPVTNADDFVEVQDPNSLEVVVLKGKDYYVIESESLDYGLIDCTLHEVAEWHALWDNFGQGELIEENLRLITESILNSAAAGMSIVQGTFPAPVGPRQVTGVAAPAIPQITPPSAIASPALPADPRADVVACSQQDSTVKVSTTGSVSIGNNVQFANGFFGFNAADPAAVARNKLTEFLNK